MKKYLLWLVCVVRGHRWVYEVTGAVGAAWDWSGVFAHRYRCERCRMLRFEPFGRDGERPF